MDWASLGDIDLISLQYQLSRRFSNRRREAKKISFFYGLRENSRQILRSALGQEAGLLENSGGAIPAPCDPMLRPFDDVERVAHLIIGCAIEVHRVLGPGLLESVYHECLACELDARGARFQSGASIAIDYKGSRIKSTFKADLIVEGSVVVEAKAVEALHPVHEAQLITYLKLTGCPAGLLMNFNTVLLRNGLRRLDHPERYKQKKERKNED